MDLVGSIIMIVPVVRDIPDTPGASDIWNAYFSVVANVVSSSPSLRQGGTMTFGCGRAVVP